MKKSSQIIDSPVISIADGREVGTVSDLVVNPDLRTVDFLLVKPMEEKGADEIIAIPFRQALGVGEYAVTISDTGTLLDLSKLNIASELLAKKVKVIDTKVLTKRGRLLGTVTEYLIDQDTGSIPFVTFAPQGAGDDMAIPLDTIISFGQQVLVVEEDMESKLLSLGEAIGEVSDVDTSEVVATISEPVEQPVVVPVSEDASADAKVAYQAEKRQDEEESSTSVELFIQRQKSFLIGKKLKLPVSDSNGKEIAPAGATITDEIFEQVYQMGRQKIIELTMQAE